MNKITRIFTDFYYEVKNEYLAEQLYQPSLDLLNQCEKDSRYENGLTTYFNKNAKIHDYTQWSNPIFKIFFDWMIPHVQFYLEQSNLRKSLRYTITSAWISRIDKNGSHEFHIHSGDGDHISGNFYINVPLGSSSFTFLRSDHLNDPWKHLPSEKYTSENSLEWHVPAEKGKLLLWKSNIIHGVRLNKVDNRIALSFNLKLHD